MVVPKRRKAKLNLKNFAVSSTVFPTVLTGLHYHTVTHRDRDLTSVQRPEIINTNSFGIVTERSRCGNEAQSKTLETL